MSASANTPHSDTDKSELEKIVNQGVLGYMTTAEVMKAMRPLIEQQCNQARIDENNMWYYKIQNAPLSEPPYIELKDFYERNQELAQAKETDVS